MVVENWVDSPEYVILEQNHPRFWHSELRARGWYSLFRLVALLGVRSQWYLSALFSESNTVICRKPA
jgi:hypothetical protein